jgi:antitoxin (DNA-binding transcriptional repressor) of toxin-antitoxin stability system
MTTISIRELRHKWPQAESLLNEVGEIIVTRDSAPVAKLVRIDPPTPARKRFDPEEHAAWRKEVFGGKVQNLVDTFLIAERDER